MRGLTGQEEGRRPEKGIDWMEMCETLWKNAGVIADGLHSGTLRPANIGLRTSPGRPVDFGTISSTKLLRLITPIIVTDIVSSIDAIRDAPFFHDGR